MNVLGPRDQVTAEENGASPVYQPGESARNDEEAGYQPASPSRAIRTYTPVKERKTLMTNSATTATTPSTPASQHRLHQLIAALPEAVDKAAREAFTDYTPEVAAQIAETMIGILTGTICPVYPGLCTVTDSTDRINADEDGRHFDHAGRTITVPSSTNPEDPAIWAAFVHCSTSVPKIGFMSEDLTTDQAREKAQQLRKFADEMDALADQVATFTQAGARS